MHMDSIRKLVKDVFIAIQKLNVEEQHLERNAEDNYETAQKNAINIKICKILQDKRKKHLMKLSQAYKIDLEEVYKEIEEDKSRIQSRTEEKLILAKVQSPAAIKTRKVLGISILEARVLYNRLGAMSLCHLIECYHDFAKDSFLPEFEATLIACCCGVKKGRDLLHIITEVIKYEPPKWDYKNVEEIDKFFEKTPITAENAKTIYLYFPYLSTDLTERSEESERARDLLGFSYEEMSIILKLTKTKNLLNLIDYYKKNKESNEPGLFTTDEVYALEKNCSIQTEKTLMLIQAVEAMSREVEFVQPELFAFVTGNWNKNINEIDLKNYGGEANLSCQALSGLFAYICQKQIQIQKLWLQDIGLDEEKIMCIKILLESGRIPVTHINVSSNNLTDHSMELLFTAIRSNPHPNAKLEVLVIDNNTMTPQSALKMTQVIRSDIHGYNNKLTVLSLSHNKIGDLMIENLVRSIQRNVISTLNYLDLSYNEFSDLGLTSLGNIIANPKCKLTTLIAVGNRFLKESIRYLTRLLGNSNKESRLGILKLGMVDCGEEIFTPFIFEGIARHKSLKYIYLVTSNTHSFAVDKLNNSVDYKRTICTDFVDLAYYNKKLLEHIWKFIEYKPTEFTLEQYMVDKIIELNKYHNPASLELLIYSQSMFSLNKVIRNGMLLIHLLAEANHVDGVDYLMRNGCSPFLPTSIGNSEFPYATVMHIAANYGYLELLKRIIWYISQPEASIVNIASAIDMNGNTPLHYAAREGFLNVCMELCDLTPALIRIKNKMQNFPFHNAIMKDHLTTFEYLSKKSASSNTITELQKLWGEIKGEGKSTALILAAKYKSMKIFKYLIEKGVDLESYDEKHRTVLHWLIESKDCQEVMRDLIKANPMLLEIADNEGETLVFYAVKKGLYGILIELDNAGADLKKLDHKNNTLLHCAARIERADIIGYLLERGVLPFRKNKNGLYPINMAKKAHIKAMLSLDAKDEEESVDVMGPPENTINEERSISKNYQAPDDKKVYSESVYDLPRKETISNKSQFGIARGESIRRHTKEIFTDYKHEKPKRDAKSEMDSVMESVYNFGVKSETKKSLNNISQEDDSDN